MRTAKRTYERRKGAYNRLLEKQKRAESNISTLRLATFTAGACGVVLACVTRSYRIYISFFVLCLALFIYLIVKHEKLIERIKYTTLLVDINHSSLQRLNGEWNKFADSGEEFVDDSHSYSGDLDIFGQSSLFQWINTAKTFLGREALRDLLSGRIGTIHDILERQQAVEELAVRLGWRQRFLAEGMAIPKKMHNPQELVTWGKERVDFFQKPWVIAMVRVCPIITVLLVFLGFVMNRIPLYWPSTALIIQYGLLSYRAKERNRLFGIVENYNDDLRAYYKMLKHIEKQPLKSHPLLKVKERIKSREGLEAFRQLDKLSSIMDSIANRRNLYYAIFNVLTMWDFQNMIALEHWKKESGHLLKDWFEALAKMEALASLAIIRFENPDWIAPTILDAKEVMLEAVSMGHPLLGENRVYNNLSFDEVVKVLLITGSNMSGKSTLLRTAGINLVLAYAGAPVCAMGFRTTIMKVHTCMRVRDNLRESVSSFYAELSRIKNIVSEAEEGKKIFFLLDEIFKGTNSLDRHTGAKVLISKLSLTNSIGMVSTHDIELCDLEQKNVKIANYHFQEFYENGQIYFDYKLRSGPSTTRNALHLMRLAGIEVGDGVF